MYNNTWCTTVQTSWYHIFLQNIVTYILIFLFSSLRKKSVEHYLTLQTVNTEFETIASYCSIVIINTWFLHVYSVNTSRTTWKQWLSTWTNARYSLVEKCPGCSGSHLVSQNTPEMLSAIFCKVLVANREIYVKYYNYTCIYIVHM